MKLSRRAFLLGSVAGLAAVRQAGAQDRFDQNELLSFWDTGTVSLVHIGDLHGQMMPHYNRPAQVKLAVGEAAQQGPNLTGEAFRIRYGIGGTSPMDYAFTHENFVQHAGYYGQIGGLDRVATVLEAVRAGRPGTVFLSGAQNGQGDLPDHPPLGQRTADVLNLLHPETLTRDTTVIERGGVKIALIRMPAKEAHLPWQIEDARANGAQLLVGLSQQGLAADQTLARDTPGLDIILSSACQDALPEPLVIGETRIFASGTQSRFVTRIDLEVRDGQLVTVESKLIPMFADLIRPHGRIGAAIKAARAPVVTDLTKVLGQADGLLFTRGALSSTWDTVICAALMDYYGAPIALSPGFGWGNSILPGQNITREDVYALCGSANPHTELRAMTGETLRRMLDTEAGRSFHGPAARHRMMRAGGLKMSLNIEASAGARISDVVLFEGQAPLKPEKSYNVALWGREIRGEAGPPLWQIVEAFIVKRRRVGEESLGEVSLKATK